MCVFTYPTTTKCNNPGCQNVYFCISYLICSYAVSMAVSQFVTVECCVGWGWWKVWMRRIQRMRWMNTWCGPLMHVASIDWGQSTARHSCWPFGGPRLRTKWVLQCWGICVCNSVDWHSHTHSLCIVLQYSKERDRMLSTYFCCSFFVFVSIVVVQLTVIPQWVLDMQHMVLLHPIHSYLRCSLELNLPEQYRSFLFSLNI